MINKFKQSTFHLQGIGLLELMLSLTVIAILLIAATRYYQSTQTARQVQETIETTQLIYIAAERSMENYGSYCPKNDSRCGSIGADIISVYIDKGLLPTNFKDNKSAWGGNITAVTTTNGYEVTFAGSGAGGVPLNACNNVIDKLTNKFFALPTSNCNTAGKIIVDFGANS